MAKKATAKTSKTVETLNHPEAKRKNIPTAEYQSVLQKEAESPVRVAYERRNRDLDPQLVWRGKDAQDWSDPWCTRRRSTSRRRCTIAIKGESLEGTLSAFQKILATLKSYRPGQQLIGFGIVLVIIGVAAAGLGGFAK